MILSNWVIKQRKGNIDMCTAMPVGKADFTYRAEGAGVTISSQKRNPGRAVRSRHIYENARSILSSVQKK